MPLTKDIPVLKKVEHLSFSASLRSDGIVHLHLKDIDDYTIEVVEAQLKLVSEFGGGAKMPVLITYTSFNPPNDETNKYAAKAENLKNVKAVGLVVDSLALRLGANFYLKFFKPNVPTKLFNSEAAAVKWLTK